MTLITTSKIVDSMEPRESLTQERSPEVEEMATENSLWSEVKASFALHNTVGSGLTFGLPDDELVTISDQSYDPFEANKGTPYESNPQAFIAVDNEQERQAVIERLDLQQPYREIMDQSGWSGMAATMAAGVLDPTVLIPGSGAIKGISAITKSVKGAAKGTAVAAGSVALQEQVLGAQQETRTKEEQAYAILGAGIFGGVVGGAAGAMSKGTFNAGAYMSKKVAQGEDINIKLNEDGSVSVAGSGSGGAMQVDPILAREAEGIAHMNKYVLKAFKAAPSVRNLQSKYGTVASTVSDVWQHGIILNKNTAGEATQVSLEALQKIDAAHTVQMNRDIYQMYLSEVANVKSGVLQGERAAVAARQGKVQSWTDFSAEVDLALRNATTSTNKTVQKVANILRKEMNAKAKKMQELELLPKTISTEQMMSYLSRAYDVDKIAANESKLLKQLTDKFSKTSDSIEDAMDSAQKTIDNMKGVGDANIQMSTLNNDVLRSKSGTFTKHRSLELTDDELSDYLIHDGIGIANRYITGANNLIRTKEVLKAQGVESIAEIKARLQTEHEALVRAGEKLTAKDLKKASKAIDDMWAVGLGQFRTESIYDPALKTLRAFNSLRMLGGVTVSSIPDVAMPIFRQGMGATARDGYLAYARNPKLARLSADELKDFGVAIDGEMDAILSAMLDSGQAKVGAAGKLDRVLGAVTARSGQIFGLTFWNNSGRRHAGRIASAGMIRKLKKSRDGKLKQKELERLRSIGIGEDEGIRILKQFEQWGEEVDGSFILNHRKWAKHDSFDADGNPVDSDITEVLGNALLNEMDHTILIPSKGDIPLTFQKNEMGVSVFQYKTFIMAATNKIVLSGLQRRDKDVVAGLMGLVAMGAASYITKQHIAGREPDTDTDNLIKEGIARSGVAGLFGEVAFLAAPGMTDSRFARYSAQSMMLGPTFSMAGDAVDILQGTADGIDSKDLKKAKKFLPLQNLFYLQWTLNQINKEDD